MGFAYRKVFFSFHYQRDIWRVNQIRHSGAFRGVEECGFIDFSLWEDKGDAANATLRRLIAEGLHGTSVTAILVGTETSQRPWVHYEIAESRRRGNGLIVVRIHNVKDIKERTDSWGSNPLDYHTFGGTGPLAQTKVSLLVPEYDWVFNNGYANFGSWIDTAAGKGLVTKLFE